jgi:ribosomal protein S18 acetylase RimI-like enzyme
VVDLPVSREALSLRFRRPTEADHPTIVGLVDGWWGGRHLHELLPRLWFQHVTGTSWIAETGHGALAGFLIGFVSPDHPDEAYVHLAATSPNVRRRGVGTALYERFFADVRTRGARHVRAICWPGNRVAVEFHRAIGFRALEGPGTRNIYGVRAFPDYDYDGEDRTVFVIELDAEPDA